jgi:hypothetical protein
MDKTLTVIKVVLLVTVSAFVIQYLRAQTDLTRAQTIQVMFEVAQMQVDNFPAMDPEAE